MSKHKHAGGSSRRASTGEQISGAGRKGLFRPPAPHGHTHPTRPLKAIQILRSDNLAGEDPGHRFGVAGEVVIGPNGRVRWLITTQPVPPLGERGLRSKSKNNFAGKTFSSETGGLTMVDNRQKKGSGDRARINLSEDYEMRYWTKKFGVTEAELRKAVKEVGSSSAKVAERLGKHAA